MTPPISMVVAAVLGLTMGYSGRRWWISGAITGTVMTIYGVSGGGTSEDILLTGMIVAIFFPLFFSIGGLTGLMGQSFRQWKRARSGIKASKL